MLNIAISGATGFIGKHLSDYLSGLGYHVIPLGRPLFRDEFFGELVQAIEHCDVVINLAGAPINKRWTQSYLKEIVDSRINTTRQLVNAMKSANKKPQLFISTSAVGYYSTQKSFDENNIEKGEGFLSELCYDWEAEAHKCPSDIRLVITRFGIVLSPDGGALQQMLKSINLLKVAVVIGSGQNAFPWIDLRDLCRAMEFIIKSPTLEGTVNLVSPDSVTQYLFVRIMAKYSKAWITIRFPFFIFKLLYGKGAVLLVSGQDVGPTRMMHAGFNFLAPTVKSFFKLNS